MNTDVKVYYGYTKLTPQKLEELATVTKNTEPTTMIPPPAFELKSPLATDGQFVKKPAAGAAKCTIEDNINHAIEQLELLPVSQKTNMALEHLRSAKQWLSV